MNTQIPRGIEVLVKKASVDPAFKAILLDRRAEAAEVIGLQLAAAEAMTLAATPRNQLEAIIASTDVPQSHRRAFLGQAAAAMLTALSVMAVGGTAMAGNSAGNRPDGTDKSESGKNESDDKPVEEQVLSIVAKQFKVSADEVKGETSLADDLHATPTQLASLKRLLEKQFKWTIPKKEYAKIETVNDVVGCVKGMIERRDAAKHKKTNPTPPATRGIQPDHPVSGGMRPDR